MAELNELVKKAVEKSRWDSLVVVDSANAMEELGAVLRKIAGSSICRTFEVDFALPEPAAAVFDNCPEIQKEEGFSLGYYDDYLKAMREGRKLRQLFDIVERSGVRNALIAVKNPHLMDMNQCLSVASLGIHVTNSGHLPGMTVFLQGGSWIQRPDFHEDSDNEKGITRGGMNYVRLYKHLKNPNIDSNALYENMRQTMQQYRNKSRFGINVFGPLWSGKSLWLYQFDFDANKIIGSGRVTVWDRYNAENHSQGFLEDFAKYELIPKGHVLLLDDCHKLEPGIVQNLREQFPRHVCSSIEKMPGFDRYINTQDFARHG